jgi:hypothetical protein
MEEVSIVSIDELQNNQMIPVMKKSTIKSAGLELYFDKSPDLFSIARMHFSKNKHLGFYIHDQLVGFGGLGYYWAMVKGVEEKLFTFFNFYLLPEARGRKIPSLAGRKFIEEARNEKALFGLSLALKGNKAVETYLSKKDFSWMPPYRILEDWVTHSIFFSKPMKNNTSYHVRPANLEDVAEMIMLLKNEYDQRDFGYPFTMEGFIPWLEKRGLVISNYYVAIDYLGKITGTCLCWDCSEFRRTCILHYSNKVWMYMLGYELMSAYWKMQPFPEAGKAFNELTITDYATKNRDPEIMHALLVEIYSVNRQKGYHFMNWGSCSSDPMLEATKGFWKMETKSHLIFSSMKSERFEEKMKLPYIDIAFL